MIRRIKGVGPKKAELLKKLGIHSVRDMVWDLPHRYEDRSRVTDVILALPEQRIVVVGEIVRKYTRANRLYATAIVGLTKLKLVFFGGLHLESKLEIGARYYFYGAVTNGTMFNPDCSDADDPDYLRILPVYHLTEGLTQREIRRFHAAALDLARQEGIRDPLPDALRTEYGLLSGEEALSALHQPDSFAAIEAGRRRICFEDLFLLQLRLRVENCERSCLPMQIEPALSDLFERVPFALTKDQRQAILDIRADLTSGNVMRRLVQGDVGSGKSIVAFAALHMVSQAHQAAMLAPTRLLAEQLHRGYVAIFGDQGVVLLRAGLRSEERAQLLRRIRSGSARVVFGTHALFQDDVRFHDLQLVVTDEQQRFGIRQRETVLERAAVPHSLYLSATPIPRTLALTWLGLRDLSRIASMPQGRKPVVTRFVPNEKADELLAFLEKRIDAGEQVYFVVPSITEGGVTVDKVVRRLRKRLPGRRIGFVHGALGEAIQTEMAAFRDGALDVLVSTTVIEVGIDVPNATVIVIMESDRFGLSQLHQLRGRVGRGSKASYCFLMSNRAFAERLRILEQSRDGFVIAEEDLKQRGAGAFFDASQHGALPVRVPFTVKQLSEARAAAERFVRQADAGDAEAAAFIAEQRKVWNEDHRGN